MSAPIFVGDELTAAGYRLAGMRVRVPPAGEEIAALTEACATAPLVLVGAGLAARIDARTLENALTALAPLFVVVPDVTGEVAPPDLATRLSMQLGIEP